LLSSMPVSGRLPHESVGLRTATVKRVRSGRMEDGARLLTRETCNPAPLSRTVLQCDRRSALWFLPYWRLPVMRPACAVRQRLGAAEITARWKSLSMSGMDGSDGPLGCPLDVKAISNDSGSGWSGVQQRF
jgi:hypothetical protein